MEHLNQVFEAEIGKYYLFLLTFGRYRGNEWKKRVSMIFEENLCPRETELNGCLLG